jgi:type IV pilus assembly protein PilV
VTAAARRGRADRVRGRGRRSRRGGFTVVEVLAAVVLLSVGLLAIAGLAATAARVTRYGARQTIAASVAQSRFDSLSSLPCRTLAVGGPTTGASSARGVTERWTVTDGFNVKNLTDTLTVVGRAGPLVYRTVLPCRD